MGDDRIFEFGPVLEDQPLLSPPGAPCAENVGRGKVRRLVAFGATTGDQALVSFANFGVSVVVGRLLGPGAYGIFTLVWSVALFLNVAQQSFLVAPMLTLGSKYEGDTSARYFGGVFQLQVLFALSTAVLIAIGFEVCVWTGLLDPTIRTVIAPLVCACFCFQMQEFARRALQALRRPLAALQCDVTAYGLQCACMGWLLATHHSDLATILWMLAASWLAGCLFFVTLCNRFVFSFSGLSWAWTTHISFGLALAIGTILQWFGAYGAMYIAAARLSAEAIGNIRGAMNIVAPLNVLAVGLQTFLSIEAAQIYRTEGTAAMSGLLRRSAARFCLTCIPAGIVLSVWARPMVRLLLGVSFRIPALWISIGFTAIVAGALFGFSVIRFKTVERTLPTTYAAGAGLLLTMITTPALIPVLGAGAVFAGWLVGQAGAFACTEWMWRQSRQEWLRG